MGVPESRVVVVGAGLAGLAAAWELRAAGREVTVGGLKYPQTTSVSLAAHLVGSQTSPSAAVARDESSEALTKAIEQMSPLDQETIALRHFEGRRSLRPEFLDLSVKRRHDLTAVQAHADVTRLPVNRIDAVVRPPGHRLGDVRLAARLMGKPEDHSLLLGVI